MHGWQSEPADGPKGGWGSESVSLCLSLSLCLLLRVSLSLSLSLVLSLSLSLSLSICLSLPIKSIKNHETPIKSLSQFCFSNDLAGRPGRRTTGRALCSQILRRSTMGWLWLVQSGYGSNFKTYGFNNWYWLITTSIKLIIGVPKG